MQSSVTVLMWKKSVTLNNCFWNNHADKMKRADMTLFVDMILTLLHPQITPYGISEHAHLIPEEEVLRVTREVKSKKISSGWYFEFLHYRKIKRVVQLLASLISHQGAYPQNIATYSSPKLLQMNVSTSQNIPSMPPNHQKEPVG